MNDSRTVGKLLPALGYGLFLAFAFFLLFHHLDNHLLWGDEGETAVLARNVTKFGVPRTFDGTNYILLHGQRDENQDHIWTWSPWMQEYIAASAFVIFGETTWAARAPFALIGWCSLVALALVAYKIYRSHWVALASVVLLGTSEVFLLHARQCRYYPISVFAEILFIYGIYQLFARDWRGVWLAAFALGLQFYSNYIVMVGNLPGLVVLAWMRRKQGKRAVLDVAMIAGLWLAAALPWMIYAHQWGQGKAVGEELHLGKAWPYLLEFHFHFLPLCFLLLPFLKHLPKTGTGQTAGTDPLTAGWERWLLWLLASYFAAILLAPGFYLRYLLPILPLTCLLAATWIFRYVQRRTMVVLLIVIQVMSNVVSMVTAYPFRGTHRFRVPLVDYARGTARPYADQFSDVLAFFKQQAQPGEIVLSFDPEFPVEFYTSLAVIDGVLMAPPKGHMPRWILPSSASGVVAQAPVVLPDFLRPYYEPVTLRVHDSVRGDSIPEPDVYQYQSASNFVPFLIYRLNTGTNGYRIQ